MSANPPPYRFGEGIGWLLVGRLEGQEADAALSFLVASANHRALGNGGSGTGDRSLPFSRFCVRSNLNERHEGSPQRRMLSTGRSARIAFCKLGRASGVAIRQKSGVLFLSVPFAPSDPHANP